MLLLSELGERIRRERKALAWTRQELAQKAGIGASTLEAWENGRLGELGYAKVTAVLAALGLEWDLRPASPRRPTLEELLAEESDASSLDRRR